MKSITVDGEMTGAAVPPLSRKKTRKKMTRKQKIFYQKLLRAGVQVFFFVMFPSVFNAAFSGVKEIFTRLGAGQVIEFSAFVKVLIAVCIFTMIFGRFFCGYACAFGAFGDALHGIYVGICRKRKKKPRGLNPKTARILTYGKYILLAGIVLMCFTGTYERAQGTSPWDVFSRVRVFNFGLAEYASGIVILICLMIYMFFEERFFCRFICPMGAVFALLPVLPWFHLHRDRPNCAKGCRACTNTCPADVELPSYGESRVCGECIQCGKCVGVCPRQHIKTGTTKIRGNEPWYVLLRAASLAAIFIWLGV